MSLELNIGEFQLARRVTRQFIHFVIIVAVAAIGWMGVLLSTAHAVSANDFVTTWKTDNPGSSNSSSITIPTTGVGYNYDVDWNNDGVFDQIGITGNVTHDYGTPGTYTIRIQGTFPRIYFNYDGDSDKIIDIKQWGAGAWTSMNSAFQWAVNLKSTATDTPNLTGVTDMSSMFSYADAFNGDLSAWNVSNVTDMSFMFSQASAFNSDLSAWNVSSVTNMRGMFNGATVFNSDLSTWNVSSVTDTNRMFYYAEAFNGDLSTWNVSSVTDMSYMFNNATVFNGNISAWSVIGVTDMSYMFSGAATFNRDISAWNVIGVTNMFSMFSGATAFNGNLSAWNVSNVTAMSYMFSGATAFNGNISAWNVSGVTAMGGMFYGATAFNGNVSAWNVWNVTNMGDMFRGASAFNGDLSAWNVSKVTDMRGVFSGATAFNGNISAWNVSGVTAMSYMFREASAFNGDLSAWNVSSVTDMSYMFSFSTAFNGNISAWNMSSVTNMSYMFADVRISPSYYDALLTSWAAQPVQSNVQFSAGLSVYCSAGAARASLIQDKGWIIADYGGCGDNSRAITSIDFTEYGGMKIMNVAGSAFVPSENDGGDVWTSAMRRSLVSLNGVALPFCTDRTDATKADYISWGANPALVSDAPPCYYLERYDAAGNWSLMATPTRFELLLPSDFDTSAPGTISIDGTPLFSFNQPAPTVDTTPSTDTSAPGTVSVANTPKVSSKRPAPTVDTTPSTDTSAPDTISIDGTPLTDMSSISQRPTFQGKTIPGSIVTVTAHSDPVVCTTTADSNGNWSCTLPSDLPVGSHSVLIAAVTPDGRTLNLGSYAVTVAGGTMTNETPSAPGTGAKQMGALAQTQFAWPFIVIGALVLLVIGTTIFLVRRKLTHGVRYKDPS